MSPALRFIADAILYITKLEILVPFYALLNVFYRFLCSVYFELESIIRTFCSPVENHEFYFPNEWKNIVSKKNVSILAH